MSVVSEIGPNQRDFLSEMVISNITYILNFSYDLIIKGYKSRRDLLSGLSEWFNCIPHSFVIISVVVSISGEVWRILEEMLGLGEKGWGELIEEWERSSGEKSGLGEKH